MYDLIHTGRKSGIGATPVQIFSADTLPENGIQIYADFNNTDIIWVGLSTLTADSADSTDGFPLAAGEGIFIPIRHPNIIYLRSTSVSNQKIWWILV